MDERRAGTEPLSGIVPPGTGAEISGERERPGAVTAMAVWQWLKVALFLQLFWNIWSAQTRNPIDSGANIPNGQHYAVLFLPAVAIYLFILGAGLWKLQKWALFFILPIWIFNFTSYFDPEFFGLERISNLLPENKSSLLLLGIAIVDLILFIFFANREVFVAFNAEEEAKILWWLGRNTD